MKKKNHKNCRVVLSSDSIDKLVLGSHLRVLGTHCKELKGFLLKKHAIHSEFNQKGKANIFLCSIYLK